MKSFPKDFKKEPHKVVPNANQWLLYNSKGEVLISIVGGGGFGLYGDGVTSFEMWDYSEDSPRGWMSRKEINEHLKSKNY